MHKSKCFDQWCLELSGEKKLSLLPQQTVRPGLIDLLYTQLPKKAVVLEYLKGCRIQTIAVCCEWNKNVITSKTGILRIFILGLNFFFFSSLFFLAPCQNLPSSVSVLGKLHALHLEISCKIQRSYNKCSPKGKNIMRKEKMVLF